MKNLRIEMQSETIHILDYPEADRILELPNDEFVKQLKDMRLHLIDLENAKNSLEEIRSGFPYVVNMALVQNAIVIFYKCFSTSNFRNNGLKIEKILKKGVDPKDKDAAKKVFDYYHDLRNKYIAHDESRYAQVLVGGVLEMAKEKPLTDVVCITAIGEAYFDEEHFKGLNSLYNLICISIKWTEEKIDELIARIKKKYSDFSGDFYEKFDDLKLNVPDNKNIFEKRY